jgi:hypothetical protein
VQVGFGPVARSIHQMDHSHGVYRGKMKGAW